MLPAEDADKGFGSKEPKYEEDTREGPSDTDTPND